VPMFAVFDAPIVAAGTPGDCEFCVQLSPTQESVDLVAELLVSGGVAPGRGDGGKFESRVVAGGDGLLALRPIVAVLLSALPSQLDAQLSAVRPVRAAGGEADCGVELFVVLKLDSPPRYELVVSAGPLSKGVVLSGVKLLVEPGICGNNMGGAAVVEPMLDQPLLGWGVEGLLGTLRSTGVMGFDESHLAGGGGDSVPELPELPVQGGGARLLRGFALAGGGAGCVVKGFVDCEGLPAVPKACWEAELMPLVAARTPVFKPSRSVFAVSLNALWARPVMDCAWPAVGDEF
jgi:hypothetical protein